MHAALSGPFRRLVVLAGLLAGLGAGSVRADLVNGDFSQGLTGWTADPAADVTVVAEAAVITESADPLVSEVDLFQDFDLPAGATVLRFTLVTLNPEDDFPPSGFGASLLDPLTGLSLVPTVDVFTDSFYIRELSPGVDQGEAASGVTLSSIPDGLPGTSLVVTLDISGLSGESARILFRVIGGGLTSDASVTIDNVEAIGNISSVPEPHSVAIMLSGLAMLAAWRRLRRRSSSDGRVYAQLDGTA